MIKKLLSEGYVNYTSYKGVKLTKDGIEEGRRLLNKLLIWEVFLKEKLGYDWKEIGNIAEKLQQATDDQLEERMYEFLDYPKYCPHGNKITKRGEVFEEGIPLSEASKGSIVKIMRIEDVRELLEYMEIEDIHIGDSMEIIEIEELGNLFVKFNGDINSISKNVTNLIYVEEVELD